MKKTKAKLLTFILAAVMVLSPLYSAMPAAADDNTPATNDSSTYENEPEVKSDSSSDSSSVSNSDPDSSTSSSSKSVSSSSVSTSSESKSVSGTSTISGSGDSGTVTPEPESVVTPETGTSGIDNSTTVPDGTYTAKNSQLYTSDMLTIWAGEITVTSGKAYAVIFATSKGMKNVNGIEASAVTLSGAPDGAQSQAVNVPVKIE